MPDPLNVLKNKFILLKFKFLMIRIPVMELRHGIFTEKIGFH